MSLFGELLTGLIVLDVVPPTPTSTGAGPAVYPQAGHGFAGYVIGGFLAVGLLVVAMILLSLKPQRADHDGT